MKASISRPILPFAAPLQPLLNHRLDLSDSSTNNRSAPLAVHQHESRTVQRTQLQKRRHHLVELHPTEYDVGVARRKLEVRLLDGPTARYGR